MNINWFAVVGWVLLTMSGAWAQEAKGYPIGGTVANFKLKNVDERLISLTDYKAQKGVIVVFTCNHCPFSKAYEDRIIALNGKFAPLGYPVLAIMPNDPVAYTDDSFENMKIRAREKGYPFPYVIDETQAVTKAFGASRTPQVFIVKRVSDGSFALEYSGAIDDNPQDAAGVQRRYVDEVLTMLLGGPPTPVLTTKAIGCGIKWK